MIYDSISAAKNYYKGNKIWAKIFDFLPTLNENSENGKYEIEEDMAYVLVSRYNTRPANEKAEMETHTRYVDIQILLAGEEKIGFQPFDTNCKPTVPYTPDIAFFQPTKYDCITLRKGVFAVFYPDEFHMPQLMVGAFSTPVIKVVVKVDKSLL